VTLDLRAFGTLTIKTDPDGLFVLGATSVGRRIIQEFVSVGLEGARLRGTMTGKPNVRASINAPLLSERR
jgi:hypothetical protein